MSPAHILKDSYAAGVGIEAVSGNRGIGAFTS